MAENLLSNFLPPAVVAVVARKSAAFMGDLLCVCFRKSKRMFIFAFLCNIDSQKKGPLNR